MEKIRNHDDVDGDATELVSKLKEFLEGLKKNNVDVSNEYNREERINVYKAVIYFEEGCEMENIRAYAVVHHLKEIANEIIYYPQDIIENDKSVDIIRREGFRIYLKTYKTQDEIYDNLMHTMFLK